MSVESHYKNAVAKLGPSIVSSMAIVAGGSISGGWQDCTKPDKLIAVLKRMTSSASAVAQAQGDFKTLDEANAARTTGKKAPQTLDVAAIYAKWNAKPAPREDA